MGGRRYALLGLVAAGLATFWTAPGAQAPLAPSLRQAAQDIESPETRVRRRALQVLREHGGPETLALLGRLVGDVNLSLREDAIGSIARIYVEPPADRRVNDVEGAFLLGPFRVTPWPVPPELIGELMRALGDDYASVRRDAAYVLAIVADAPASPRIGSGLLASLSDSEPAVRVAAARGLARLRVTAAAHPLIGRINDEALDVRLAAMRALGDIRERDATLALTEQFEYYDRGIAGRQALDALARIGDPRSVPLFEACRRSDQAGRRTAAYEGLARAGAAKTITGLEADHASEGDERVRLAIVFALASSGRSIAPLVAALADDDLRPQALEYLVEVDPMHAAELQTRLRDPEPVVRLHVAIALGFVGGPEVSKALAAAASDPDAMVRNAAQIALLRMRVTKR